MRRTFLLVFALNSAMLAAIPERDGLPLFFVPNHGQAASPVRFMVKSSGLTAHLLSGGIKLRIAGLAVSIRFEGANPGHRVEGALALPGRVNFLTGSEANWRTNLPLFGSVVYRQLYPGIDMEYGSAGRNLKSEFRVAAGADPSRIRVRYVSARAPRIDVDGSLVIPIEGTELREGAPVVYQECAGVRHMVAARFLVHADGTVGFRLGDYDVARPLVIDPVLSYSTLLGGSGSDGAMAIAVDASGSAYVAGFTDSLNFPATNPVQGSNGGGNDVFVAKLSPSGNSLMYCTYLGGAADDRAFGIAVDPQGNAYITGSTTSHDFPVHSAFQPKLTGYRNAFVVKLNPAGNTLVYSTYLGGNASDAANGIAVDASGAAYIVGDTTSFSFPSTGFQRSTHGGQDAFVAKLSVDGAQLVYSTYLGGSSEDHGAAIAIDGGGTAYVTGATTSTDFPVLNATQRSNAGGQDAFVARLSADGNYLLFSTYLGGSGGTVMYPEIGQAIALDMNGNAYVTGVTGSTDFPLLAALQTVRKGGLDAFVTKMNPSGAMVYSTYLGGSGVDVGNAIAVDAGGAAYVVGYTISTDLPVSNALQSVNAGDYDAFVARLSPGGDGLQYLSYFGGSGSDSATAVALDPAANVYLAGYTLSTNFPPHNAFQTGNGGNYGAFVTKVDFSDLRSTAALSIAATHTGNFVQGQAGASYTVTVANHSGAPATTGTVTVSDTIPAGLTLASMTGAGWTCNSNTCTRNDVLSGGASYPALTVTVNVAGNAASPQINSVTVSGGGATAVTATDSTAITTLSPQPSVSSVSPATGSGLSQTFAFTLSDPAGASAVQEVYVIVNSTFSYASGCFFEYHRPSNTLWLANDADSAWQGSTVVGSGGPVSNSQCTLNGAGGSISINGNQMTVNVSVTFKPAFVGTKNVYVYVDDSANLNSGWQTKGSWTVPGGSMPPSVVSVSPSSGSGLSQTFTFVLSDSAGAGAINEMYVIVNGAFSYSSGCFFEYYRPSNTLWLANDADSAWQGSSLVGSGASVSSSQCTLNGAGASVNINGNQLTVSVPITFKPAFAGAKNVYVYVDDTANLNSGWQNMGTWTVPGGSTPPTAVSVSPSSGSGLSQTFAFTLSDSAGASAINEMYVIVSSAFSYASGCFFEYHRPSNTLWLANDADSAWQGSTVVGSGASVSNSQCTVTGTGASVSINGNQMTVNVPVTFKPAFSGAKNVYVYVDDNASLNSAWQNKGSWNVQ